MNINFKLIINPRTFGLGINIFLPQEETMTGIVVVLGPFEMVIYHAPPLVLPE